MTTTGAINSTIKLGTIVVNKSVERTEDGTITSTPTLAGGSAGSLTTRTDDDTGIATLAAGHGLAPGNDVNVFWAGGVRFGMNVSAVNGDDVTVDLGAGAVLPAQATALVVTKRTEINVDFAGDTMAMLLAQCEQRAHIEFLDDGDVSLAAKELTGGNAWTWTSDDGGANPLAGDAVGKAKVSIGTVDPATFNLGILYDNTG